MHIDREPGEEQIEKKEIEKEKEKEWIEEVGEIQKITGQRFQENNTLN